MQHDPGIDSLAGITAAGGSGASTEEEKEEEGVEWAQGGQRALTEKPTTRITITMPILC